MRIGDKIKSIEIINRPKSIIKSRQWWHMQIKRLKPLFKKHLDKKHFSLFKDSVFTLLITNNKEIQDLNKKFRRTNKPTDVLSFHLNKHEQTNRKYLGDIVISTEYAKKSALKKKMQVEIELQMLLIHGWLHLLGYDHKLQKEAKIMFSLQNKILLELNF